MRPVEVTGTMNVCVCQSFRSPTYCSHNYQYMRWIHMHFLTTVNKKKSIYITSTFCS